jgi:fatty acid kinase fatty acid binding subunit
MILVTDSAADLPAEEAAELEVAVAPLFIKFPEGEVSSADISADEFYDRLERMQPEIPTTSQPSPEIFAGIYRQLAETHKQMIGMPEILSIHISSGLSGTLNSARMGAAQAKDAAVQLFDSLTLSGGQRFQVLAAARAMRAGWKLEAILERLAQLRQQTEVVYTLDTLEYLRRGGRIGRVQALAGALLHLKPVIRVDPADGKYSTAGKERTIRKSLESIADSLAKKYGEQEVWASVLHGRFGEQAEALAGLLRQRLNLAQLEILRISPVLGVHTGPGIVGAAVTPMKLMEF